MHVYIEREGHTFTVWSGRGVTNAWENLETRTLILKFPKQTCSWKKALKLEYHTMDLLRNSYWNVCYQLSRIEGARDGNIWLLNVYLHSLQDENIQDLPFSYGFHYSILRYATVCFGKCVCVCVFVSFSTCCCVSFLFLFSFVCSGWCLSRVSRLFICFCSVVIFLHLSH